MKARYLSLSKFSGSALALFCLGQLLMSPAPAVEVKRPHMDLAFCIDTTGSMQNEIDQVKARVKELTAKLASGKPAPVVRVGMVAYRDRGDAYITRVFPFTDDIDKFVKDVADLKADGGGDGPEAVNQGLHSAVHDLAWDKAKGVAKLMFLVGDAPPHLYSGDYKWSDEAKQAIACGIQINTIGCAGLESYPQKEGVDVFKEIARLADGRFESLTYRQELVTPTGGKETIISAGGEVYKVKGTADWRRGVSSLKAMGAVEHLASPAALPLSSSFAGATRASRSFSLAGKAEVLETAGGALSSDDMRKVSNLDQIMLQAATDRAKKVLDVNFDKK